MTAREVLDRKRAELEEMLNDWARPQSVIDVRRLKMEIDALEIAIPLLEDESL